jgi:hypothetical protein
MIEVGQFFELGISVLKEEGQPKLATLCLWLRTGNDLCRWNDSPIGYSITVPLR